jgi:uncharacterized RDD family membrane protein YckC
MLDHFGARAKKVGSLVNQIRSSVRLTAKVASPGRPIPPALGVSRPMVDRVEPGYPRMNSHAYASPTPAPRYARFSRRLRAMLLDWIITLIVMFGALLLAAAMGNDNVSRALGVAVVIALLLYEPVLVSYTGGTLGHFFAILRVVDARNGGNISFPKACARGAIKGLLGLHSFVTLAATRPNQAVHDLLTRSTVQIRDPAKAFPGQYMTERAEPAAANMPSGLRRVMVIFAYLLLMFVADAVMMAGSLSPACIDSNFCSAGERMVGFAAGIMPLALAALLIGLGWKGRLLGARKGS